MRRFPPPWSIEEHNKACFIVRDSTGQVLGYFYFEDEPGRRSMGDSMRVKYPHLAPNTRISRAITRTK
jgi:hypothetical protein